MTSLQDIASRIPDRIRSERLLVDADPIGNAVATSTNPAMQMLFAIWYEFVEPSNNGNIDCPYCLQNILTNFRAIVPALLGLEREYQMLLRS